jgi:hypothetical protein
MGSAGSETPSPNESGLSVTCLGMLLAQEHPGAIYKSPSLVGRGVLRG